MISNRIKTIRDRYNERTYRNRRDLTEFDFASSWSKNNIPYPIRSVLRFSKMVDLEIANAIIYPEDRFGMYRKFKYIPPLWTKEERENIEKDNFVFDDAYVMNIATDYTIPLRIGFDGIKAEIIAKLDDNNLNDEQKVELSAMLDSIYAFYRLVDAYKEFAIKSNNVEMAKALNNIPRNKPNSFYEAILMVRIIIYALWLNGNKHITIGRFDQYLYPFYVKSKSEGLSDDEALELIEEFFLSLNFDADIYPGVQQGDNGQSLVIGGCDLEGNKDCFNEISKFVLKAQEELCLIDPKINMRVNKNTPDEWFILGTELTKRGLGFPQYSNDDVVIDALVRWGYDIKDARNYVVAACWEFIIPGLAYDIPNVDGLDFPLVVSETIKDKLDSCSTFNQLLEEVDKKVISETIRLVKMTNNMYQLPSPFQSILMDGCISRGEDVISGGMKYNNFGFHGVGISNAVDALAAVKKNVYEDKTISKEQLHKALENDFVGYERELSLLKNSPKMGENIDEVDSIAVNLTDAFATELEKYKNCRGGIFRAGTGSAMYYIWMSQNLGATAEGRRKGEPFAANFSPQLGIGSNKVLSVLQSFTKPHLVRICNGGPLTLEFHSTVFKNDEGTKKVAMLVKTYMNLGGHQLQLNAVNREVLLDAQLHPEQHKELIVRVWGWSGYFNELDLAYQNQIIKRTEFN